MAELIFRKKYTNPWEYTVDMAKTSGKYNETLASSSIGTEYTQWLANKRLNKEDLSVIDKTDLSYLDPVNSFNYLLYKDNKLTDDSIRESIGMTPEEFQTQFSNGEGYFKFLQNEEYKKRQRENQTFFEQLGNSTAYVLGQGLTAVGQIVEGLIDLGGTVVGAKDFVAQDTTGAGAYAQNLAQFGRDYVYGDSQYHVARMLGDSLNSIVKMVPMMLPGVGHYIGTGVYYMSMAGNVAEQTILSNPDATMGEVILNTALQTGLEAAIEKINPMSLLNQKGWFKSVGKGLSTKASTNMVGRFVKSGLGEGFEEVLSEFIGTPLEALVLKGEINSQEMLENALYGGLIGALTGGIMEGISVASVDPKAFSNLGNFTRAQTLALKDWFGENNKTLKALTSSPILELAHKNNTTIEKLKNDSKFKNEYAAAVAEEKALNDAAVETYAALQGLVETIGKDRFQVCYNLAAETRKEQLSNMKMFAESLAVQNLSDSINKKIIARNERSKKESKFNTTFIPVNYKYRADKLGEKDKKIEFDVRSHAAMNKFADNFKKLFGKEIQFGWFVTENGFRSQATVAEKLDDNTYIVSMDAFENTSPEEFMNNFVDQTISQNLSKEIKKETLDKIRKADKKLENLTDAQLCYFMLFDERTQKHLFGIDKQATVKITSTLKHVEQGARQVNVYEEIIKHSPRIRKRLYKTLSEFRKNILSNIPEQSERLKVARIMSMDLNKQEDKNLLEIINNTSKAEKVTGYWAYARQNVSNQESKAYNVRQDLSKYQKDIQDIDINNEFNFDENFVKQVKERYGTDNWAKAINTLLYEQYGVVYYGENFFEPVDLETVLDFSKFEDGKTIRDLRRPEFSENIFKNLFGDYADLSILYQEMSDDSDAGYTLFEGTYKGIWIDSKQAADVELPITLRHEILHVTAYNNKLPYGAASVADVEKALVKKYGLKSTWYTNKELIDLYKKAWGDEKYDSETFAEKILAIFYARDVGEIIAEYKKPTSVVESGLYKEDIVRYFPETNVIVGQGKLRGLVLKLDSPTEPQKSFRKNNTEDDIVKGYVDIVNKVIETNEKLKNQEDIVNIAKGFMKDPSKVKIGLNLIRSLYNNQNKIPDEDLSWLKSILNIYSKYRKYVETDDFKTLYATDIDKLEISKEIKKYLKKDLGLDKIKDEAKPLHEIMEGLETALKEEENPLWFSLPLTVDHLKTWSNTKTNRPFISKLKSKLKLDKDNNPSISLKDVSNAIGKKLTELLGAAISSNNLNINLTSVKNLLNKSDIDSRSFKTILETFFPEIYKKYGFNSIEQLWNVCEKALPLIAVLNDPKIKPYVKPNIKIDKKTEDKIIVEYDLNKTYIESRSESEKKQVPDDIVDAYIKELINNSKTKYTDIINEFKSTKFEDRTGIGSILNILEKDLSPENVSTALASLNNTTLRNDKKIISLDTNVGKEGDLSLAEKIADKSSSFSDNTIFENKDIIDEVKENIYQFEKNLEREINKANKARKEPLDKDGEKKYTSWLFFKIITKAYKQWENLNEKGDVESFVTDILKPIDKFLLDFMNSSSLTTALKDSNLPIAKNSIHTFDEVSDNIISILKNAELIVAAEDSISSENKSIIEQSSQKHRRKKGDVNSIKNKQLTKSSQPQIETANKKVSKTKADEVKPTTTNKAVEVTEKPKTEKTKVEEPKSKKSLDQKIIEEGSKYGISEEDIKSQLETIKTHKFEGWTLEKFKRIWDEAVSEGKDPGRASNMEISINLLNDEKESAFDVIKRRLKEIEAEEKAQKISSENKTEEKKPTEVKTEKPIKQEAKTASKKDTVEKIESVVEQSKTEEKVKTQEAETTSENKSEEKTDLERPKDIKKVDTSSGESNPFDDNYYNYTWNPDKESDQNIYENLLKLARSKGAWKHGVYNEHSVSGETSPGWMFVGFEKIMPVDLLSEIDLFRRESPTKWDSVLIELENEGFGLSVTQNAFVLGNLVSYITQGKLTNSDVEQRILDTTASIGGKILKGQQNRLNQKVIDIQKILTELGLTPDQIATVLETGSLSSVLDIDENKDALKKLVEIGSNIAKNRKKSEDEASVKNKNGRNSIIKIKDRMLEIFNDEKNIKTLNTVELIRKIEEHLEDEKLKTENRNEDLIKELEDMKQKYKEALEDIETSNAEIKRLRDEAAANAVLDELVRESSKQQIDKRKVLELLISLSQQMNTEKVEAQKTQEEKEITKEVNKLVDSIQKKMAEETEKAVQEIEKTQGKKAAQAFKAIQTYRYLALLSSPSTWVKNWTTNVMMYGLDTVATLISNTKFARLFDPDFQGLDKGEMYYIDGRGNKVFLKTPQYNLEKHKASKEMNLYVKENVLTDQWFVDNIVNYKSKYSDEVEDISGDKQTQRAVKDIKNKQKETYGFKDVFKHPIKTLGGSVWSIMEKGDLSVIKPKMRQTIIDLVWSNIDVIADQKIDEINIKSNKKPSEVEKNTIDRLNSLKDKKSIDADDFQFLVENSPEGLLQQFIDFAKTDGENTFFRTSNAVGRLFKRLNEKHPVFGFLLSLPMPFVNIAWNMTNAIIDYSPAGFAKAISNKKFWDKTIDAVGQKASDTIEHNDKLQEQLKKLKEFNIETQKAMDEEINRLEKIEYPTEKEIDRLKGLRAIKDSIKVYKKSGEKARSDIDSFFEYDWKKPNKNITGFRQIEIRRQVGKAVVGTSLMLAGTLLTLLGAIGVDEDDYLGPCLIIGGVKIRLSDMAPVTSALAFPAYIKNIFDKEGSEESFAMAFSGALENTLFDFLTDAIQYADSPMEYMLNILSNGVTQYIPNIAKSINRLFDHQKSKKSTNLWNRFLENIFDAVPGLRLLALDPKTDPYTGDIVKRYDLDFAGIFFMELIHGLTGLTGTYRNPSVGKQEAKRLGSEAANATGRFSYNGKQYVLDTNAKKEFEKLRSGYIKNNLDKLVTSNKYQKLSNENKKAAIKLLYSKATDYAKNTWIKK